MGTRFLLLTMLALLIGGCQRRPPADEVSFIAGRTSRPTTPDVPALRRLVRLDREGQVVPDLAARWAILDDGRDYIFRIDDASGLSARRLARLLRTRLRQQTRNPDLAALGGIQSLEAVTNTVVELRLESPRQDLLTLLARPELSLSDKESPTARTSHIYAERAGTAVARFAAGRAALVLGGTFLDLPVARAAPLPARALRFDPASGLFGFAVRNDRLSLDVRNAVSLALDRDRIARLVGAPRQAKATTIGGSLIEPPLEQRQAAARALVASLAAHVRIAMPEGPGATLLFRLVAADLAAVGIAADRTAADDRAADLQLVDRVAPAGTLATLACALATGCDPRDRMALINPPFIPIMTPVRWSLVAPELDLFTENALAVHPLDQLRSHR